MNRDRSISDAGVEMIEGFEGLRLQAYTDSVGVWTIGYGHTGDVREGDLCTFEQAETYLRADLEAAENCIRTAVTSVRLSQHQFDALTSFIFNIGCMAFRNSTMLRKIEVGDFSAASDQFGAWTRAGTEHPMGLIKRRNAEASWFRTPD